MSNRIYVGSSETKRDMNYKNIDVDFNSWLAGLIDGDGYLGKVIRSFAPYNQPLIIRSKALRSKAP
jgi:hypothetical protein